MQAKKYIGLSDAERSEIEILKVEDTAYVR